MRKALIERATGKVVNIIEIEKTSNWPIPPGHYLRNAGTANPGDTWDAVEFVPKPPTEEEMVAQKRGEAKQAFLAAVKASASTNWGKALHNLAIALGLLEQ